VAADDERLMDELAEIRARARLSDFAPIGQKFSGLRPCS